MDTHLMVITGVPGDVTTLLECIKKVYSIDIFVCDITMRPTGW